MYCIGCTVTDRRLNGRSGENMTEFVACTILPETNSYRAEEGVMSVITVPLLLPA
jgi:hypothetical protein